MSPALPQWKRRSLVKNKIFVEDITNLPAGEHWAILQNRSIHIPGDERSRTAPGHCYPESTEHAVSYVAYLTFEEFENDLKKALLEKHRGGPSVIGIHVQGSYTHTINIQLTKAPVMRGGTHTEGGPGSTFTDR